MSLLTPPVRPDANATSGRGDPQTYRVALGKQGVAVDDFAATGPPILLLHGIPGWRGIWRNAARHLAADCRVIAPDLLGFGESSEPSGEFHASGQADMVVQLIRQLGCGPVHLVGFDFGGPIAVLVYRQAPELVSSLMLAATNVFTDTPIPVPLRLVRTRCVGDFFARVLFSRTGLAMMWLAAVKRKDGFRFAEYRGLLHFPQGITWTRRVFQSSLRHLSELYAPVQATLTTVQVPCAVIWGEGDPFFPIAIGERTASRIPGATLVRLPGCGHFLPEEDPAAFAEAVMALVRSTADREGLEGARGRSGRAVGVR
jgi:pimeloyl-ACP methyl ester carboxylesterase